jgi:hypothetical protein
MLAFKEAKLGLADTDTVIDNLLISAIAKPPTPQIIENMGIPYTPKTSICNEVKCKRAVGKVELNFTNNDVSDPHTVYYQIYVDNQLVIDRSTGFEILAGSQLAKIELVYQIDPADKDLELDFYFWADEAGQIQLDNHRARCGFGSETAATACIKIEKESLQAIYAEFATTHGGGTYTFTLKAFHSGVSLKTGSTNLSMSDLLPYSEFYLTPQVNEIVYLTGISLV